MQSGSRKESSFSCSVSPKKVLLADTLAKAVNYGYSNVSMLDSISALLLAVGYLTELYFDLAAIAIWAVGLGK